MSVIGIRLFIIKNPKNTLDKSEAYLKSRGFEIRSATSIREAIVKILEFRPQFVMIPVDHPNKSVKMLPMILQQSTTAISLVYTESSVATSVVLLQQFKADSSIYPPISGPHLERTILSLTKQSKEKEEATVLTQISGQKNQEPQSTVTHIRGQALSKQSSQQQQADFDAAKAALVRLASIMETDTDRSEYSDWKSAESKVPTFTQEGVGPGQQHSAIQEGVKNLKGTFFQNKPATSEKLDQFSQLALTAFQKAIAEGKQSNLGTVKIDKNRKESACLSVTSPVLSGYILVISSDPEVESFIAAKMKDYLQAGIANLGQNAKDMLLFDISLETIPFEEFGIEASDFYTDENCNENIVALAFFKEEDPCVVTDDAEQQGYRKVSFKDVVLEKPLPYEIFLYLPTNKKFLLYSSEGARLLKDQRERLQKKGVAEVYIKESNVPQLFQSKAESTLQHKFHETKKRLKKA